MPATMDPFLRAYTGAESMSVPNSFSSMKKRNPLDELDDASVSSGRKSSLSDRKSSLGSDSLWGDARKLSEAGVRRTSDSSVVLTEDTDSFIIGDKVWVGGTKPGTIAYIGETQFAPGEWAGVVLDQPIGKNDGSVANIRYFQCEPKKGIFSRLTRLTRLPLLSGGSGGDVSMNTSFAGNGNTSYAHIPPTSPPSTITRSSSISSGTGRDLKVGDRVIVMSSTGSRAGMLRYIGETEFAKGVWCGVECDDPVGKNDGAVQGVRYFTCQPMYGLFAPVAKVSLSPSPNRRPSCAMHPPGPARQNTRDSISSTASTASRVSSVARVRLGVNSLKKPSRPGTPSKGAPASNSSEALVKEKEMRIEELLKQLDLERLAVTRAATQAEEAERQLDVLKQELREMQEISESTQADLLHQVAEINREKEDIKIQMEDNHNKLDDITFRFEEETVIRSELEEVNKTLEERIKQLEDSLSTKLEAESKKGDLLEQESTRVFEMEETNAKLRALLEDREAALKLAQESTANQVKVWKEKFEKSIEEFNKQKSLLKEEQTQCMNLKNLSEEGHKFRMELQAELAKERSRTDALEKELKALNLKVTELEVVKKQSQTECKKLKEELEIVINHHTTDKESLIAEIQALSEKYKKLEDENNNNISEISVLNLTVTQLQNKIKSKEEEFAKLKEHSNSDEVSLKKEITELKESLVSKATEFESKERNLNTDIVNLKHLLSETKKESEDKDDQIKKYLEEIAQHKSLAQEQLNDNATQIQNLKNDYEYKLEEVNNKLDVQNLSINALKESNEKLNMLNAELKRELENTKQALILADDKISELNSTLESQKQVTAVRDGELISLKATNEEVNKSLAALTLELGDWKRNCQVLEEKCEQVNGQKNNLEKDLFEMMNSSSDSSQQLSKLNESLRAKEKECADLQEAAAESRKLAESNIQKLQQELQAVLLKHEVDTKSLQNSFSEEIENKVKETNQLSSKLIKMQELFDENNVGLEKVLAKEKDLQSKLNEVLEEKNEIQYSLEKEMRKVSKLELDLSKSREGAGEVELDLRSQLDTLKKENNTLLEDLRNYKSREEKSLLELEEKTQKEQMLTENAALMASEKDNLVTKYEEKIKTLMSNVDCLKSNNDKLDNLVCEKDVKLLQLRQSVDILKNEMDKQKEEIKLRDDKIKEITEVHEVAKLDTASLRNAMEELQERLQQQENIMNTDKSKLDEMLIEKESAIRDSQSVIEELKRKVHTNEETQRHRECESNTVIKDLEEKCLNKDKLLDELKNSKSLIEQKVASLEKELIVNQQNNEKEYLRLSAQLESEKTASQAMNLVKESRDALERQVEQLQRENNDLRNKLKSQSEITNNITIETTNNNTTEEIDPQMTIKFLNSMISDLQGELEKKEEEIQCLKSGEVLPPTRSTRTITPRLFCDICDMFDLHDTDDCPRQAMDSPPPRQTHNQQRGVERPYCESCEMFGHETGTCEEETF